MDDPIFNEEKSSISEQHGLSYMSEADTQVFSPGVSTGGTAEMKMASVNPKRHVIATTIDQEGLNYAIEKVRKYGYEPQIELKLEDVSQALPYQDNIFDYIYARLVLHYLDKEALGRTLKELYRVLKPGKKLFIVVRSNQCPDATNGTTNYEESTGFTYYESFDTNGNKSPLKLKRYFHSKNTISKHLKEANFEIDNILQYDEQLYIDFKRSIIAPSLDNIIEVVAHKN